MLPSFPNFPFPLPTHHMPLGSRRGGSQPWQGRMRTRRIKFADLLDKGSGSGVGSGVPPEEGSNGRVGSGITPVEGGGWVRWRRWKPGCAIPYRPAMWSAGFNAFNLLWTYLTRRGPCSKEYLGFYSAHKRM